MLFRHVLLLLSSFSCALVGAPQASVPSAPPWVSLAAGKLSYHADDKGTGFRISAWWAMKRV